MSDKLLRILFPPKCVLCKKLLADWETDLCHSCRTDTPPFIKSNFPLSFIARWTGVWYYKDTVRQSILRYKFYGRRSYADAYARVLAVKLQTAGLDDFDVLTWVPVSRLRRLKRGYDQVELLVHATGRELNVLPLRTLKKIRNTPPQSGFPDAARRRANVLNAYRVVHVHQFAGKRVLLLDDILTTGATASECARVLLTAGAREVTFAAVAVTGQESRQSINKRSSLTKR